MSVTLMGQCLIANVGKYTDVGVCVRKKGFQASGLLLNVLVAKLNMCGSKVDSMSSLLQPCMISEVEMIV